MNHIDHHEPENRKLVMFFELLAGVYGAAKMDREWPTDKDRQIRNKLWESDITKYSIDELRGAIDNARKQMENAEESFLWPNVGLILSGCKRHANQSHRLFIPPPKGEKENEEKVNSCLQEMRKGL